MRFAEVTLLQVIHTMAGMAAAVVQQTALSWS